MVIYGEYLFLENFFIGGILLFLSGKLIGGQVTPWRIALGAIACGLVSFSIFIPMSGILSAVYRITAAVLITMIGLGGCGVLSVLKKSLLFLILTFLTGGSVMAFLLWQQETAVTGSGAIYMEPVTWFKLICFGTIVFGISFWFVKLVRRIKYEKSISGEMILYVDDRQYSFRAMVDSGNFLKEPISGKPVILLDRKGKRKLSKEISAKGGHGSENLIFPERYAVVPFKAVGTKCGCLEGFRSDKAVFFQDCAENFPSERKEIKKEISGAVAAFYEGNFEGFEAAVSREILFGGIIDEE